MMIIDDYDDDDDDDDFHLFCGRSLQPLPRKSQAKIVELKRQRKKLPKKKNKDDKKDRWI